MPSPPPVPGCWVEGKLLVLDVGPRVVFDVVAVELAVSNPPEVGGGVVVSVGEDGGVVCCLVGTVLDLLPRLLSNFLPLLENVVLHPFF